jgi:sugar phosphate isomerase/epimerase
MAYGISTSILGHLPLEQALRRLAAGGIGQIEISTEPPHFTPGAYEPADVRGWLDELGLNAPVGHALFGIPNFAALDESERSRSVVDVAASLELLAAIGTGVAVVHPTGYSSGYNDDNRSACVAQSRKSMFELASIAGDIGIRLAWENLPHRGAPRPFHDMSELRATIDDMPGHVGLCLDTTHALISGHDPLGQLNIAVDRLFSLHLHDSDGVGDSHWVPGRGIIDWQPFIRRLDELEFAGPRTIEAVANEDNADQVLSEAARVAASQFGWTPEPESLN